LREGPSESFALDLGDHDPPQRIRHGDVRVPQLELERVSLQFPNFKLQTTDNRRRPPDRPSGLLVRRGSQEHIRSPLGLQKNKKK
jgi:hypothetical protein